MAKSEKGEQDSRGRHAKTPRQINLKGWRDILLRVKNQIGEQSLSVIAAGVAFYGFLALFPAVAALISIYGIVITVEQVEQQIRALTEILPEPAQVLIEQQLSQIVAQSPTALGWGMVISILLGLWSANKGTKNLFKGLNIVYEEKKKRGFLKENAVSLLFTLFLIIIMIISMALIVVFPLVLNFLELPGWLHTLTAQLRWLLLAILVLFTLSTIYRFAPVRRSPKWKWVSWGAVFSTIVWLIGSALFSFYVSNFGAFNETYGSLGAVVVLLLWFLLTSFIVLIGGEINSEMEHQTIRDTTSGPEKRLGKRDAYDADDVGDIP
ncbi:YihY/virulence factor BrkB family protein [Chitinispirillales bacterium ANBcel5]|uniref:YihY/virulence factor BrkB family protein n=1 Tax=Cellulosispirillum alkaliphilum TaxID=3039283 RepID=UPI002A4E5894|nr:YihY/virulence factor BrkB family protein [Chitinispirillales bacterium ANBcel5]